MDEPRKLSLKQEIEKEAAQIEEEIAANPDLEQIKVTEEMDRALKQRIQAYERSKAGNDRDMEASEELAPDLSRFRVVDNPESRRESAETTDVKTVKTVKKRPARKRRVRIMAALAAALVLALGLGMTSFGSKSYWKVLIERITGTSTVEMTNVEDMESQDSGNQENKAEVEAYQEINDLMGRTVVRMIYKPEQMYFTEYELNEEIQQARLFYEYQTTSGTETICYTLYLNEEDSSWGKTAEDEKLSEEIITVNNIDVGMKEYDVPNKDMCRMEAEFQYEGVHYWLVGIMEKEEMKKIVENLHFS